MARAFVISSASASAGSERHAIDEHLEHLARLRVERARIAQEREHLPERRGCVSIGPGEIALTRTRCGPSSIAR
jgi:hypothetical protein